MTAVSVEVEVELTSLKIKISDGKGRKAWLYYVSIKTIYNLEDHDWLTIDFICMTLKGTSTEGFETGNITPTYLTRRSCADRHAGGIGARAASISEV